MWTPDNILSVLLVTFVAGSYNITASATGRARVAYAVPRNDIALDALPATTLSGVSRVKCLAACTEQNCSSFNYGARTCELFDTYFCADMHRLTQRYRYKYYDVEDGLNLQELQPYHQHSNCTAKVRCSPKCFSSRKTETSIPTSTTNPPTTTTDPPTTTTDPPTTTTDPPTTTTDPPTTTTDPPTTTTDPPTTTTDPPTTTTDPPTTTTDPPTTAHPPTTTTDPPTTTTDQLTTTTDPPTTTTDPPTTTTDQLTTTTDPPTTTTDPPTTTTDQLTTTTDPPTTTTDPPTTTTDPPTTTTDPPTTTTDPPTTTTDPPTTTTDPPTTTTDPPTTAHPPTTTGYSLITITDGVSNIGDVNYDCFPDYTCGTINSDCRELNKCQCVAGYSYNYTTHTCDADCPGGYGQSYHVTIGQHLGGAWAESIDLSAYNGDLMKKCFDMCKVNSFCITFEYHFYSNQCLIGNMTKLQIPELWLMNFAVDHGQRNCLN